MEKINIINNENQTKKFGRSENGLCYKTIHTDGLNLTQERFNNLNLEDTTNLLSIQFDKIEYINNYDIEMAKRVIEFQSSVANKIILVPLYCSIKEFNELESLFKELYPNETYNLVLFGIEKSKNLFNLLESNKNNDLISSVEIIERSIEAVIQNIKSILNEFSVYKNIGIVQLQYNQGKKYNKTNPFIFYKSFGASFFSKFKRLRGGKPPYYFKFDYQTCEMKKIGIIEEERLRNEYGSNLYNYIEQKNLNLSYSKINEFDNFSKEEIRKILQQILGEIFSI